MPTPDDVVIPGRGGKGQDGAWAVVVSGAEKPEEFVGVDAVDGRQGAICGVGCRVVVCAALATGSLCCTGCCCCCVCVCCNADNDEGDSRDAHAQGEPKDIVAPFGTVG